MSNYSDFLKIFDSNFAERPFDQKETMQWLTNNKIVTASWGFNNAIALREYGLIFKVNGHHHKGWVLITLAGNDTYTLRFFSTHFNETREKIEMVYCDVLQDTVDKAVERIKDYSN